MDDKLQSMYKAELQLKRAATIASALMLLIVLMGIFGVLSLALTKRTKEIAVRKVLGGELKNIIAIFIRQYAVLLLLANLIAWPLTYWLADNWLRRYSSRCVQNPGNYFLPLFTVTLIAFALISAQCMKVALTNPVKSLKTE